MENNVDTTRSQGPSLGGLREVLSPTLACTPGLLSGGSPIFIERRGKRYSIHEIAAAALSKNEAAQQAALQVLTELSTLNRTELTLVATTLLLLAQGDSPLAAQAQVGLPGLLREHYKRSRECVHLAVQSLQRLEKLPRKYPTLEEALTSFIREHFPTGLGLLQASRSIFLEQAHTLIKSLAVDTLKEAAKQELQAALLEQQPEVKGMRKELAALLIMAVPKRASPHAASLNDLQELATSMFTSSETPSSQHAVPALPHVTYPTEHETVTSQTAERRKQFGLAVTLELVTSHTLLGRSLSADEFENALRFNASAISALPANRFWPHVGEWQTIEEILRFAESNESLSAIRLASLYTLLATRIKVEDPRDPRESSQRPDALDPARRVEALTQAAVIRDNNHLSQADIDSFTSELSARLLSPEFASWQGSTTAT